MADSNAPQDGARHRLARLLVETWLIAEIAGVLAVCAGVWAIYWPAAVILAGLAVIFACERGG